MEKQYTDYLLYVPRLIWRFIKWYFEDFWKIVGWFLAMAFFIGLLQAFIVYPVQVLATIIIGSFVIISFVFFMDLGK